MLHVQRHRARPSWLLALIVLAAGCVPAIAQAQSGAFPNKAMRVVIPFPPSGVTDALGRTVAAEMQKTWGVPVVPENRPGASGSIGAEVVAKAAPDGHTLFLGHIGTHGVNPALFAKLPYDPVRDFAPVSLLVNVANLMLAHPSVPANNLQELLALARAHPGKLTFASPGAGTSGHMSAELLKALAKVDLVHVPYKGAGPAAQDLLGGQVQLLFDTVFSQMGNVRAGKLKTYGITSAQRSPLMPEVPTIAEQGVPGYEIGPWFGLLAPAGVPADVLGRLNAEAVRIMRSDEIAKRFSAQGLNIIASTPEAFAEHIRLEIAKWARVVKETGATAN